MIAEMRGLGLRTFNVGQMLPLVSGKKKLST